MKSRSRLISFLLLCAMILLLCPVSHAAETGSPAVPPRPSWVEEDEYVTFPEQPMTEYQWQCIQAVRAYAEAGNPFPAYEENPVMYNNWYNAAGPRGSSYKDYYDLEQALLTFRFYQNEPQLSTLEKIDLLRLVNELEKVNDPRLPVVLLWFARARTLIALDPDSGQEIPVSLYDKLVRCSAWTVEDVLDSPFLGGITQEQRSQVRSAWMAYSSRLAVYLDGQEIAERSSSLAEIKHDRTMLPIYLLAEPLSIQVGWDGDTGTVTLDRAGRRVILQIGSQTAYVDGTAVQMDAAPYISQDRTLLPAAYVAQFFGQKVEWDAKARTVSITEDKDAAGGSNLEAWALPMSAVQMRLSSSNPARFGGLYRTAHQSMTGESSNQAIRQTLLDGWGITDRADLVAVVRALPEDGHNALFLTQARQDGGDSRRLTRELWEKWGERGILCWDLFRASTLVQWGYMGGYLTYPEALALLEPAARSLQENFSSWDEAYENYVDGYLWWSGADAAAENVWNTERGQIYQALKQSNSTLFDESLFETGVIPVPGLTAEQIARELS